MWLKAALKWRPSEPTDEEMDKADREANSGSQFDTKGLKAGMWHAWKRGDCDRLCMECVDAAGSVMARVVAFVPKGVAPPWEFWGKVFQWFGPSTSGPWYICWFGADSKRCFPAAGELGAEHVNGGYTTTCSNHGIYIYRKEEATRVLIHEMMHAACLDEPGWSIPDREAMVETWAELILIALKARGVPKEGHRLWKRQALWIADSNARATKHGVHDDTDYAWRYLVGRTQMYARLGIAIPVATSDHPSKSTRFTDPALDPV